MSGVPFEVWKSLYTDDLSEIYHNERHELSKVSMIVHVLEREFNSKWFLIYC